MISRADESVSELEVLWWVLKAWALDWGPLHLSFGKTKTEVVKLGTAR